MNNNFLHYKLTILMTLLGLFFWALKVQAGDNNLYQNPSSIQLEKAQLLFENLLSLKKLKSAKETAKELGLHWYENERHIRLTDKKKIGWGDYRFSKKSTNPNVIALQAPHRYYDKHTGVIAKKLFKHGFVTSIALNSLPRYTAIENDHGVADLARLSHSFHNAYTRAFVSHYPFGKLIQIHGFSAKKRHSTIAQNAHIILSNASHLYSEYLLQLQACQIKNDWKSIRYPQQVSELGATQNSIGILMRHLGHPGFYHIELNLKARKSLIQQESTLIEFGKCL